MESVFQGVGWKVRLQQKRHQYTLALVREVAIGCGLKKGDDMFYYLVECNRRKALLVFLDGSERPEEDLIKLKGVSFLVKN